MDRRPAGSVHGTATMIGWRAGRDFLESRLLSSAWTSPDNKVRSSGYHGPVYPTTCRR